MPKGLRNAPKCFEKCPRAKAISSQRFDLFWLKIWQNTFEMVFNKNTYGFLDIFFSFLTLSDWNFDFLKMTKNGNFEETFQFERKYLKNHKRYPKKDMYFFR